MLIDLNCTPIYLLFLHILVIEPRLMDIVYFVHLLFK